MIGERVKHAREYCGLTQSVLADLSGVAQSRISDIEASRESRPHDDDITRIARATSFPVSFFELGPMPDLPDGNFRRLKRGTVKASRQVRAQARQIIELVQRAEELVTLPPVGLEPVRDFDSIEDVAQSVRERAGVGSQDPIPNVTRALERAGVIVAGLPNDIADHDGFSVWPDFAMGGRPIIVYAASSPGDRQRFTISHETGHLVLHSARRKDLLDIDRAEKEAHEFAGALLLPHDAALAAMRMPLTLNTLANVKATYGISIGAAAQRARTLGLIDDDRFVSIRKQMTSRGWHRSEPVDVPRERPVLMKKVLSLIESGSTVTERASSVHFPAFAYRALVAAN